MSGQDPVKGSLSVLPTGAVSQGWGQGEELVHSKAGETIEGLMKKSEFCLNTSAPRLKRKAAMV